MNIRHLKFFIAVIENQGVSRAAQRLHVSQPAVSAAMKALEEDLGRALFERRPGARRARPTPEGLHFYEHARAIISRYDQARQSLSGAAARPATVRIGALRTLASSDVARAQAALMTRYPQWRWSLREGSELQLAGWLTRSRIDIAVTTVDGFSELTLPLWEEPYVVLAGRGHRLASGREHAVQVRDLADEPLILREACELKRGALRAAGFSMKVAARTSRDELAMRLVAQGVGIAIAPRSLAIPDTAILEVSDLGLSRRIGLRWHPDTEEAALEAVRSIIGNER